VQTGFMDMWLADLILGFQYPNCIIHGGSYIKDLTTCSL